MAGTTHTFYSSIKNVKENIYDVGGVFSCIGDSVYANSQDGVDVVIEFVQGGAVVRELVAKDDRPIMSIQQFEELLGTSGETDVYGRRGAKRFGPMNITGTEFRQYCRLWRESPPIGNRSAAIMHNCSQAGQPCLRVYTGSEDSVNAPSMQIGFAGKTFVIWSVPVYDEHPAGRDSLYSLEHIRILDKHVLDTDYVTKRLDSGVLVCQSPDIWYNLLLVSELSITWKYYGGSTTHTMESVCKVPTLPYQLTQYKIMNFLDDLMWGD